MSLPVLAALVVIGVGMIVAAIHFTGGSRGASLATPDAARSRFAIDFPSLTIGRTHVTIDRRSAFLEVAEGRVGLVHAVGAKFLTRLYGPADVTSLRRSGESAVLIRFSDFTFPGARFEFENSADADRVAHILADPGSGRRAA
ncbi:MAG: hypothetical protein KF694_21345 [Mesorhizobium sp.]|nr:hypothetical protein [Mesorhizobium sp.]